MTPQEQQLLEGLTQRVNQTQLPDKDAEAEEYLQRTLGRNADALYILAQTVLVQQYALEQAKQQLDQAKQQPPQPAKPTSFLGNLLGMSEPAAPPPPPAAQYTNVQTGYAQTGYAQQGYGSGQSGFGTPQQGGFLRSALQTATGVAAGALAFQGIESLLGGFGHHAGYGQDFGGFGGGREEIVNNYYGDAGDGGSSRDGFSSDMEDRRDDAASQDFADSANDSAGFDDSFSSGSDDSF